MRAILGAAVAGLIVSLSALPLAAKSGPTTLRQSRTPQAMVSTARARRADAPGAHGTLLEAGRALAPALVVKTTRAAYIPYQTITVDWSAYPADSLGEIWTEPASVPRSSVGAVNAQPIHGIRGRATFDGFAEAGEYAVRVTVGTSAGTTLLYEYDFTVVKAPAQGGRGTPGTAKRPKGGDRAGAIKAHGTLLAAGRAIAPGFLVKTTRAAYLVRQKITVHWSGYPTNDLGEIWIEPASVPRSTVGAMNVQFIHGIRGHATFDGFAKAGEYAVRVSVGTSPGTALLYEYDVHVGASRGARGTPHAGTASTAATGHTGQAATTNPHVLRTGVYDCMSYKFASNTMVYVESVKLERGGAYEQAFNRKGTRFVKPTRGTYRLRGSHILFRGGALARTPGQIHWKGYGYPTFSPMVHGQGVDLACYYVPKPA